MTPWMPPWTRMDGQVAAIALIQGARVREEQARRFRVEAERLLEAESADLSIRQLDRLVNRLDKEAEEAVSLAPRFPSRSPPSPSWTPAPPSDAAEGGEPRPPSPR